MARTDSVQVYRDGSGEWRWRRKAANGAIVADSSEGYTERRRAVRAAKRELDPTHLSDAKLVIDG